MTYCSRHGSIAIPAVSRSLALDFHESDSYGYPFRSKSARERLRIPPALAILMQYPG